jgi:segregation and condensation protein B
MVPMSEPPHDTARPEPASDEPTVEVPAEEHQVAFDINDFPGGARSAVEAVLMVVDEPVSEEALASALELPVEDVGAVLDGLARDYGESERGFMLHGRT